MNRFKQLEDSILLGPQPSDQDLEHAKQHGIKTVIDLRLSSETPASNAQAAARSGLDYANIPIDKASLSEKQIAELDRVMQEKEGPFLIHCASGARAAMLLALSKAKKNGWTAERTFDEARNMGFDLKSSPEFAKFVVETTAK
jgi:uncharacterized protein (TIGR01244 family)